MMERRNRPTGGFRSMITRRGGCGSCGRTRVITVGSCWESGGGRGGASRRMRGGGVGGDGS